MNIIDLQVNKTFLKLEKKNGKRNGVIETAKEMLKKKLSIDLICEITKLSKEEVEKIKESI
jgi:hypothetical protein